MQYAGSFPPDTSGLRCYFPEWADRPVQQGRLQESDRNSYMAGGYAEEFGYRTNAGPPPTVPALLGDPEQNAQWHVQIAGLHPGYPECARPLDRGLMRSLDATSSGTATVLSGIKHTSAENVETWQKQAGQFKVVHVEQRDRPLPIRLPLGITLLWKDFRIRRRVLGGSL